MAPPDVLFITTNTTRTGAPLCLLRLLEWLKAESDLPFDLLFDAGGELERDFAALAWHARFRPYDEREDLVAYRAIRLVGLLRLADRAHRVGLRRRLRARRPRLIYANTVVCGEMLDFLSFLDAPVITHVHELEFHIARLGEANFAQVQRRTAHYVATSAATKANLVDNCGIRAEAVDVVPGFIRIDEPGVVAAHGRRAAVRRDLGIPAEAFVVGACGRLQWGKGPDLFVQVAGAVHRRHSSPPLWFVWIGGGAEPEARPRLDHVVRRLGVEPFFRFVDTQPKVLPYMAACDCLAVPSREEALGLVALEAGSLGLPVLCFDGAGGTREFVEDDAGRVVPYLDVEAMAAAVRELAGAPDLAARLGARAAEKVRQRHTIAQAGSRILEIIRRFL